jgi:hypothetical protein
MNKTFSQRADEVKANGGNAVKGVVRINQENVAWTFRNFMEVLGSELYLRRSHTAIIGSAGKKAPGESSGDIDIAIEIEHRRDLKFDIYDFIVDTLEALDYAFKDMRQIGIISLAYPIMNRDGEQKGKKVQIDLMIVDSIEYAKWGYYSPDYAESEYKGLYRNELNFFIAKHVETKPSYLIGDVPVSWTRYWFSTKDGLLWGSQTLISEKTGNVTKTPRVTHKELVTNDPDRVASFLYGEDVRADDILTFQDAISAMLSPCFPHKDKMQAIIRDTIAGIEKNGYPVPCLLTELVLPNV